MLKTIIIDDETPARDNLKQIIKDNFTDVLIIGEADSVKTGVGLLKNTEIDLLFLDVNLTDGNGFSVLQQIEHINFKVIFITAYDTFAIKAFQFNALDYILKPIEVNQLNKAIEKAKILLHHNYITKEELNTILDNYSKNDENKKLAIHESNKISFVALKNIIHCKADGNYTTFYIKDSAPLISSKTLKTFELQLPSPMFYRVHQSSIININYIKEYNKEDGGYLVLKDGVTISIARRRKDEFLTLLKQYFS